MSVERDQERGLEHASASQFPQIKLITQPAQSPDLNICDLSFFNSLATAVHVLHAAASAEAVACRRKSFMSQWGPMHV